LELGSKRANGVGFRLAPKKVVCCDIGGGSFMLICEKCGGSRSEVLVWLLGDSPEKVSPIYCDCGSDDLLLIGFYHDGVLVILEEWDEV
jgi:hypothetical protein